MRVQTIVSLVRVGSAKALTREGPDGQFLELDQVNKYDIG